MDMMGHVTEGTRAGRVLCYLNVPSCNCEKPVNLHAFSKGIQKHLLDNFRTGKKSVVPSLRECVCVFTLMPPIYNYIKGGFEEKIGTIVD